MNPLLKRSLMTFRLKIKLFSTKHTSLPYTFPLICLFRGDQMHHIMTCLCAFALLPLPGMPFYTQRAPTHSLRPRVSPPLGRLFYPPLLVWYIIDASYLVVSMVDSLSSISLPNDSSKPVMVIPVSW